MNKHWMDWARSGAVVFGAMTEAAHADALALPAYALGSGAVDVVLPAQFSLLEFAPLIGLCACCVGVLPWLVRSESKKRAFRGASGRSQRAGMALLPDGAQRMA